MKKRRKDCKCCVKGCIRVVLTMKHMLCKAHYDRYARNGDPGVAKIAVKKVLPVYKPKD